MPLYLLTSYFIQLCLLKALLYFALFSNILGTQHSTKPLENYYRCDRNLSTASQPTYFVLSRNSWRGHDCSKFQRRQSNLNHILILYIILDTVAQNLGSSYFFQRDGFTEHSYPSLTFLATLLDLPRYDIFCTIVYPFLIPDHPKHLSQDFKFR